MGKDTLNHNKPSSRSNKPYDVSNSFVRKVASKVSGYFGGLFSTPEAYSQGTSDGSNRTTPDPELTDSDTPSLTRVSTLDYASPVSNVTTGLSKNYKVKINSPEPIPGPSRLQTRYELENFKFGGNVGDRGTPSIGSSGLHKLSRLDEVSDSPVPSYSGVHIGLGRYDLPVSREESSRNSAGPCSFGLKLNVSETPRSSVTGSNKIARLEPDVKCSSAGDDHSESSESTSGCSSLVPQADRLSQSAFVLSSRRKSLALDDKLSYARQLKQSRNSLYLNRSIPVHAETPRPSRTPSFDVSAYGKPILNKSVRETMLSSPFYTGQTTYGGAAAARRGNLGRPSTRNQIAVKPATQAQEGINMSHTARRILAALEEFSTPLNDVKRIPTPTPPFAVKRRNIEPSSSDRLKRPALTVPTVADMLKMRRLEQIQDSTAMARQVATATRQPSPPPRRSGKIVTKMKNRDKEPDDPPPPPPDLPKVSLQFTSLPKFDMPLLNPVQTTVVSSSPSFTFSTPSVPTTASNSLHLTTPPNQFNFSPPMPVMEWLKPNQPTLSSVATPESVGKLKRKSEAPENNGTPVPAAELVEGSVMDILWKSVSKQSKTTASSKVDSVSTSTVSSGFGDMVKPLAGSWTCDTCMIVNKPDVSICVACETKRVEKVSRNSDNSEKKISSSFPLSGYENKFITKDTVSKNETHSQSLLGFGNKFKPDPGSWSCDDCMVRNKADCTKCVSCSANKPGSVAKDVKKNEPWKCSVCLITNDANREKCSSCDTSRPNGPLTAEPKFDFGLPSVGFKFGIDKAGVDVKTTASNGPVPTALVNTTNALTNSGTFTFGIPKTVPESENKSVGFGPVKAVPSPTEKSSFLPVTTTSSTGFTFGYPTTTVSTTLPAQPATKFQSFGLNGPSSLSNNIAEDKSASSFSGATSTTHAISSNTIKNDAEIAKPSTEQPTSLPFKFGAEQVKAAQGLFTFGAKNNVDSKPFPSSTQNTKIDFTFGALISKPLSSHNNTFVTAPPTSGLSVPSFGTLGQTQETVPDFGKSGSIPFTTTNNTPNASSSNATFVFGAASAPAFATASAISTPAFGASLTTATPSFKSAITTQAFGSTTGSITPAFGQTSGSTTPAFGSTSGSTTPAFGSTSGLTTSAFGSTSGSTAPAFGPTSGSTALAFGSPLSSTTPSFGSTSGSTTQAFGTVNPPAAFGNSSLGTPAFGNNSPAATMFGSKTPQVTAPPAFGTPSFGAASSVETPTFGTPATAPASVFGTSAGSTTPAFGSAGVSSTAMFGSTSTPSFGVSSSTQFGNPTAASPVPFGTVSAPQPAFGQNSAPQAFPTSSPFQFGTNNSGAANSLSLSVPSSFNFTGGQTPTFSADPRSGPEPKRRIIRALRRSQK